MIIFRPFERSRTASISARSASERRNLNTLRLSSGCSDTPRRVPFWVWKGGGSSQPSQAKSLIDSRNEVDGKKKGKGREGWDKKGERRSGVGLKRRIVDCGERGGGVRLTHRRGQRQRKSGLEPTERPRSRWSPRRVGRRFSVIRRGVVGTRPNRPTLA